MGFPKPQGFLLSSDIPLVDDSDQEHISRAPIFLIFFVVREDIILGPGWGPGVAISSQRSSRTGLQRKQGLLVAPPVLQEKVLFHPLQHVSSAHGCSALLSCKMQFPKAENGLGGMSMTLNSLISLYQN